MNVTNFVAQKAAKKMCKWKFIYPEQEDEYTYSIQVIFEKLIGYFILLFLSVFNHLFWQTVIFLIFFSNLRKYTGGYHAGSFFECMGLSVIVYETYVIFFYPLIINLNYLKYFLLGVSLVVVLILGTVNHPNMQLDEIELSLCKKAARKMAVVEVIVIIISCFLGVDNSCISFMNFGFCLCAIMLLIAKIIRQEVIM